MITYNIPVSLIDAYRDQYLVLRSNDPEALVKAAATVDRTRLVAFQLVSASPSPDPFTSCKHPAALDVMLDDGESGLGLLYSFSRIAWRRPVRVSIPAAPGCSKAVKVAASLGFAVRLLVTQPSAAVVDELHAILEYYLHNTTVSQPVNFFHGLVAVLYHGESATLWDIQGEDPDRDVYIRDDGTRALSDRLPFVPVTEPAGSFLDAYSRALDSEKAECVTCSFRPQCAGYFKLPDRSYSCAAVRELLAAVTGAVSDLKAQSKSFLAECEGSAGPP